MNPLFIYIGISVPLTAQILTFMNHKQLENTIETLVLNEAFHIRIRIRIYFMNCIYAPSQYSFLHFSSFTLSCKAQETFQKSVYTK